MITSNDKYVLVNLHRMLNGETHLNVYALKDALHDEIINIINNNWDIRSYSKLREIFPSEFPKGKLEIVYTDKWYITKG